MKIMETSIYDVYGAEKKELTVFDENNRWGFISDSGDIAINPIFDEVYQFSNGLAAARMGEKWGYINHIGEYIIEPKYDHVNQMTNDIAWVKEQKKTILIDKKGFVVADLPDDYEVIDAYVDGASIIQLHNKYGFIDTSGKIIIPTNFSEVSQFNSGLSVVTDINNEVFYINKKGERQQYDNIVVTSAFSEGLSFVRNNELKCGYINNLGELVIPYIFDNADFFSEGVASITRNNKKGYIDKTGFIFIEPQFDTALPFIAGSALVSINNKYMFINKKGMTITKPMKIDYVDIQSYLYPSNLVKIMYNRKYILMNRQNGEKVYTYK